MEEQREVSIITRLMKIIHFFVLCMCVVPLSAASSLALDDAYQLLSASMDSLNLPQKSQSAVAPAAVRN